VKTLQIARFAKNTEPRALIGEVLAHDALNDTTVDRYRQLELLGRGGMGEVTKSLDVKIGREIALKTMLPIDPRERPQATSRFLREARVQALLEHPSIVPVYDIAVGPDGPYFTMKRVRGETLLDIIESSRSIKSTLGIRHSRHRLLSAFVTVCLAVDYAHKSGVVHRDLKPDNIMLGSHGEVYVLDWGVARVLPTGSDSAVIRDEDDTRDGDMVGTPGYMSPEQVLGQLDLVGASSDVFALGAILYEMLTLEPLIADGPTVALLEATLNPNRLPPEPRTMPPELYALALRATHFHRDQRPGSARELAEAVERFLDGDRDLEQRRKLATECTNKAKELANLALDGPIAGREQARAGAMREAGRALAYLPEHEAARSVVLRMFGTPPTTLPTAAKRELDDQIAAQIRTAMRDNTIRAVVWVLLFPLILLLGTRITWLVGVILATGVACASSAAFLYFRRVTASYARLLLACLVSAYGGILASVFGPLVFVPGFAAANTVLFAAQGSPRHRITIMLVGCATFTVPLLLELAGVVPPSMSFSEAGMLLLPRVTTLPETFALITLLLVSLVGVVAPSVVATRLRDALFKAEEKLLIQKWHLEQLAPKA